MPHAHFPTPIPNAPCHLLTAECPIPNAQCPMLTAQCQCPVHDTDVAVVDDDGDWMMMVVESLGIDGGALGIGIGHWHWQLPNR